MEYVASLLRGVEGLCQQLFSRHSLHAICRLCRQGLCSLVPSYGHFVFTAPVYLCRFAVFTLEAAMTGQGGRHVRKNCASSNV